MERGWNAKGLLRPLWARYEGGRDALAAAVGTTGSTLSSINSGKRNLGHDLAARLASALEVTVFDLGAPPEALAAQTVPIMERLDEIREFLLQLQPATLAVSPSIINQLDAMATRLEDDASAYSAEELEAAELTMRQLARAELRVAEALAARRQALADGP